MLPRLGVDAGNLSQLRVSPMSRETGDSSNTKPVSLPRTMSGLRASSPRTFKKGGKVRRGGVGKLHKGEAVVSKKKYSQVKSMLGKGESGNVLEAVGHELKANPPKILAKTRRKSGAKRAEKQRRAILLSKARRQGANV